MVAYYNELEPYAAEWLRNLIKAGHIPHGEVDTRSIVDVAPDDLRGFTQCHFFAGIGGWSHALRLAGWPDDRPVWTGSCPCQPFSVAGKGAGTDDPRHLWPHFHRLISAVRPPVVMGEQVAGAAGYGWLDGVRADLEREGYAGRGADLPALAVNAPHIRQRLYWVALDMADSAFIGREERQRQDWQQDTRSRLQGGLDTAGADQSHMADAQSRRNMRSNEQTGVFSKLTQRGQGYRSFWSDHIWLTGADGKSRRARANISLLAHGLPDNMGRMCPEGYAQTVEKVDEYAQKTGQSRAEAMSTVWQIISQEPEAFWPVGECAGVSPQEVLFPFLRELLSACDAAGSIVQGQKVQEGEVRGLRDREETTRSPHRREPMEQRPGEHSDPMRELSWVLAQHARAVWEAYWRANATAYPLLSHGEKNRVGRLRAYGNAICAPLAAEVISAFMESV